eukprot:scaffold23307_cov101-Isochrysis_galbana.AAC.2
MPRCQAKTAKLEQNEKGKGREAEAGWNWTGPGPDPDAGRRPGAGGGRERRGSAAGGIAGAETLEKNTPTVWRGGTYLRTGQQQQGQQAGGICFLSRVDGTPQQPPAYTGHQQRSNDLAATPAIQLAPRSPSTSSQAEGRKHAEHARTRRQATHMRPGGVDVGPPGPGVAAAASPLHGRHPPLITSHHISSPSATTAAQPSYRRARVCTHTHRMGILSAQPRPFHPGWRIAIRPFPCVQPLLAPPSIQLAAQPSTSRTLATTPPAHPGSSVARLCRD